MRPGVAFVAAAIVAIIGIVMSARQGVAPPLLLIVLLVVFAFYFGGVALFRLWRRQHPRDRDEFEKPPLKKAS